MIDINESYNTSGSDVYLPPEEFEKKPPIHKCSICGYQCRFDTINAPTVNFSYKPYCPNCFEKWVASHVPLMVKV